MTEFPQDRIVPWAAARSIFGATAVMEELDGVTGTLEPSLLPDDRIAIGQKGLVFNQNSLLRAIERGFSIPELFPMLINPLSAIKAIITLKRVSRFYHPNQKMEESLSVILRAGLEAVTVYLNHHSRFNDMFSDFSDELITFNLAGSEPIGWLRRSAEGLFTAGSEPAEGKPSVELTFLNKKIAFEGLLRGIDQLGATASGEMTIQGRLPLMDKIGYVSRIAQKEVPLPKL